MRLQVGFVILVFIAKPDQSPQISSYLGTSLYLFGGSLGCPKASYYGLSQGRIGMDKNYDVIDW